MNNGDSRAYTNEKTKTCDFAIALQFGFQTHEYSVILVTIILYKSIIILA